MFRNSLMGVIPSGAAFQAEGGISPKTTKGDTREIPLRSGKARGSGITPQCMCAN